MNFFNFEHYIAKKEWENFLNFIIDKPTPFLTINLKNIKEKFLLLQNKMPAAKIFYAIKANPIPEILELLRELGCYFDIASIYELELLLNLHIKPERISYGNTIKKETDIAYAYQKGVRFFVCDSFEDLDKIAIQAPNSKVFFRLITDGRGADWPLSKKFGCHPERLEEIIIFCQKKKLTPYGISFHVGSQQRDIGQWDGAIKQARYLFESLKAKNIHLKMLNIGGGLPCDYLYKTRSLEEYLDEINRYLKASFSDIEELEIFIEPGRALVGNSGIIISEVIHKTKKSKIDLHSWIFLDIGIFNGLIETLGEAVKYPITSLSKKNVVNSSFLQTFPQQEFNNLEEMILAGPTCDSVDILYKEFKYRLPKTLSAGDKLLFFATGAYTLTYSSIAFNGFPPLNYYVWQ